MNKRSNIKSKGSNKPATSTRSKFEDRTSKSKPWSRNNAQNRAETKRSSNSSETRRGESNVPQDAAKERFSSLNDLSWYTRFPELIGPVSRVAFPNKVGMVMDAGRMTSATGANDKKAAVTIPGVAKIKYKYTFGYSDNNMSPISIAAAELWSVIRKEFSGSLPEDPPDLIMYVIALDMIHAFIADLKRQYGLANAYTGENLSFPAVLFQAVSPLNIREVQANLMHFESVINTLVDSINVFSVPYDMDIYNRHRWMNENVYMDEPTLNSQTYVFVPETYYIIDETGDTGTRLLPKPVNYTTIDEAFDFGMSMINALKGWEDALTIKGHIERAFANSTFYKAELLEHGYRLNPVWVPEVLMQIENLSMIPGYTTPATLNQNPLTNAVIFEPTVTVTAIPQRDPDPVLNIHAAEVTPADVILSTRLTAYLDNYNGLPDRQVKCGTEVVTGIDLYVGSAASGEVNVYPFHTVNRYAFVTGETEVPAGSRSWLELQEALRVSVLSKAWNHFPLCWHHFSTTFSAAVPAINPILDCQLANVATVDPDTLINLHRVCLYSEYNCFARV